MSQSETNSSIFACPIVLVFFIHISQKKYKVACCISCWQITVSGSISQTQISDEIVVGSTNLLINLQSVNGHLSEFEYYIGAVPLNCILYSIASGLITGQVCERFP